MAEEMDVIGHLLDVEREASQILNDAQKEADVRVAEARAQAESQFKDRFGKIISEIDAQEETRKQEITAAHKESFDAYSQSLSSNQKNAKSFVALLDKLLYA